MSIYSCIATSEFFFHHWKAGPDHVVNRSDPPSPSVTVDVLQVSLPAACYSPTPACLTAATQCGCLPVTQGPCVNSRGKKKRRRGGNQKVTLLQTWTCGLSCSSPSGTVSQPWIWRRAVRCPSLSWRWVCVCGGGPLPGKLDFFFLSEVTHCFTLLPHFLPQFIFHHVGSLWARWGENIWSAQQIKCHKCYFVFVTFDSVLQEISVYAIWYYLSPSIFPVFLNHMLSNKEQICSLYFEWKCFHCWKRAQYAPLSAKSTRVTVCSQSVYEWEPSSPSWASMYQLVVQRVLWHWTWPENSKLNRHEPVYVKRTLLQWEQGRSGNMLVIVVSRHSASMKPLYFVDLIVMSLLGLVVDQTPFPATFTFLRCVACRCWLTASQPHD